MRIPRLDITHTATLGNVILGLLALINAPFAVRVGLWIALVVWFAYWLYLVLTESTQRLRVEADPRRNVIDVRLHGPHFVALTVEAVARFQNPDTRPHVITSARVRLLRRRWRVFRRVIAEREVGDARPESHGSVIYLDPVGLRIPPVTVTPFYVFSTGMQLPDGAALTKQDRVELRLAILGQPDLVVPITSPEIQLE